MDNTPQSSKIRGVGDVIAKITDGLGISKCSSCSKRQEILNQHFPISSDVFLNTVGDIKNSYRTIISKLKGNSSL